MKNEIASLWRYLTFLQKLGKGKGNRGDAEEMRRRCGGEGEKKGVRWESVPEKPKHI
ncbi:hypothetical protein [Methanosarcina sp. KYL-1]|uniref:hypothetical protein n=1 Tax=Methanosarcina sp. KYL-1 TaxID=2602068 RepID=UPI002101BE9E|nr:hypothetical protein [Methanosarcina sp. KYL-1]